VKNINIVENILKRLHIGQKNSRSVSLQETLPLKKSLKPTPLIPSQYIVGCCQSIGKQREHNEDSIFVMNTTLASESECPPIGIFIVADGMGGHQHGEVASDAAVRAMAGHVLKKIWTPFLSNYHHPKEGSIQETMMEGIVEAQKAVVHSAPGGGTTLTAAFALGENITIAHVGDSRAYIINADQQLRVVTRDHSFVMRLQEMGQITADDAAVHPQRNVLYRAVGQNEPFEPDIMTVVLPRGGYLLLCSDGLWGVISEKLITQLVLSSLNPEIACQKLVDAANEAGGPDNISVILVYYPE
jgi:serine/threonine protein phosphatase PrpC